MTVRIDFSPRALAAWALVGYAALHLMFAFLDWVLPDGQSLMHHSTGAGFADLFVMAMPVVAVLLAVYVSPPLREAKLITAIALAEYAFSLFFGLFSLMLATLSLATHRVANINEMFDSMRSLVMGLAGLALIAVAGWATLRAFTRAGGRIPIQTR